MKFQGSKLSNLYKKKRASIMVKAGLCIGLDGGWQHVPTPPHFIPPETQIHAARYPDMLRSY